MTKITAFRDTMRSYRDGHPRSLGLSSCHRETGSQVSLMPCPLSASVSILVATIPVSQLTLLLLLFIALDIGVAMLLSRDFLAYRQTKFVGIASFPVLSGRGARLTIRGRAPSQ
jgi:hypothetical protein